MKAGQRPTRAELAQCPCCLRAPERPRTGVLSCSLALLAGSAAVVVDGSLVSDAAVLEAVDDAGFEVELRGAEEEGAPLRVTVGLARLLLTSVSTERDADAAALLLAGCPGVLRAGSLARGSDLGGAFTAEVEFAQEVTGPRTLLEALAAAGVTATLAPASKRSDADGARALSAAPQNRQLMPHSRLPPTQLTRLPRLRDGATPS